MKFRVRAGKFTVRDGVEKRVYRKGDVVESDQPLNTIFKNAFETADDLRHRRRAPVEPVVEEDGGKADAQEEPVGKVTLRPVHRGGGRWDVVKVLDGVVTDETVNEVFLKKADAAVMAAAGVESLVEA